MQKKRRILRKISNENKKDIFCIKEDEICVIIGVLKERRCKMNPDLIEELKKITSREESDIQKASRALEYYTIEEREDIVDYRKMTDENGLIGLYKRTRFVDYPAHAHNYLEVIYICSGSLKQIIDNETELVMEKDDLLFLRQGVKHKSSIPTYDDVAIHFMILPEFLRYPLGMLNEDTILRRFIEGVIREEQNSEKYLHFHLQEMREAQNLLENMITSLIYHRRNEQRILQATMGMLFLELTNRTYKITIGAPSEYERNLVLKALQYVEEQYRTASLDEFAKSVNQPSYYISRLVKKYGPYTFTKYLQRRRLIQAGHLLESTSYSIEEIMEAVGYENSSHFHRLFREEYHMTPKEYRKNMQKKY